MKKTPFVLTVLLIGLSFFAVACGGESESEKEREAESGRGTVTCSGDAMTGETRLPADFPQIEGITFVKSQKTGPTQVVDGYADRDLGEVYDEFNSELESAGYTILFHEQEKDDAEVSYRSADKSTEGQVALRECEGDEKTSVHITARPGD